MSLIACQHSMFASLIYCAATSLPVLDYHKVCSSSSQTECQLCINYVPPSSSSVFYVITNCVPHLQYIVPHHHQVCSTSSQTVYHINFTIDPIIIKCVPRHPLFPMLPSSSHHHHMISGERARSLTFCSELLSLFHPTALSW